MEGNRTNRGESDRPSDRSDDVEAPGYPGVLMEAKERFAQVQDYEAKFRQLYIADVKFANGDSDNGWQWDSDMLGARTADDRPCLTVNKVAPLVLLIVNDARKNKPSIKVKPIGENVTVEAAKIWMGLFRHIEKLSNAQSIYDEAVESQVEGGVAYWRVTTGFVDDESFDQEIRIEPVADQMGVYLDNNIKRKDGSDAMFGFVFEEIPRKQFQIEYPSIRLPPVGSTTFQEADVYNWISQDTVRVAEYYRIRIEWDELFYVEDSETGDSVKFRRGDCPPQFQKVITTQVKDPRYLVRKRKVKVRKLEWYKIAGNEIIEFKPQDGAYVPIVRLVGREKRIQGRLERKGHVRNLKDPQRIYNYNSSAEVESGALATKTKWVGPAEAFSANIDQWKYANTDNAAFLAYKHRDANDMEIPAPQRIEPGQVTPVYLEGMRIAASEMEMASGQYQPQQQNPNIERTPRAIGERRRSSDTATFHFVDMLALAIQHTARIILDLAPYVYDTERVIQILDPDGTLKSVSVQPDMDEAHREEKLQNGVKVLFNPKVGKYAIEPDIGPAYATQREETWDAGVQILTAQPELINIIGDIFFRAADFPMSDDIAERMKRNIRANAPWLLEDAKVGPAFQKLQEELAKANETVGGLLEELSKKTLALKAKDEMRDIDVFDAQTRRLTAAANSIVDLKDTMVGDDLVRAIMQVLKDMGAFNLTDVIQANKPALDRQEIE